MVDHCTEITLGIPKLRKKSPTVPQKTTCVRGSAERGAGKCSSALQVGRQTDRRVSPKAILLPEGRVRHTHFISDGHMRKLIISSLIKPTQEPLDAIWCFPTLPFKSLSLCLTLIIFSPLFKPIHLTCEVCPTHSLPLTDPSWYLRNLFSQSKCAHFLQSFFALCFS